MTRQPGNFDGQRGSRGASGRGDGARGGSRGGAQGGRGNGGYGRDGARDGGREGGYGRDGGSGSRGGSGSSRGGQRSGQGGYSRSGAQGGSRSGGQGGYGRDNREGGFKREGAQGGPARGGSQGGQRSGGQRSGGQGGQSRSGQGGQRGAQSGPRAFADERFGLALGPVKRRRGPRKPVTATPRVENPDGERLQKVMAHAGVASRRVCEEMILTGRVEVNGRITRELGVRVKPETDTVHVDGVRIQLDESLVYFAFNKPAGVVSSMSDPEGRRDISDFLREGQSERLYHVGRLDFETEGLLLLTNDGELAHRLTHPSFEVPKTYLVQVRGPMPRGVGAQLREGVELEDGLSKVDSFRLVDSTPGHVLVEVELHSGKNRIVRRMFDAVGFPVQRLVRLQVGPIRLGDQRQGSLRKLGKQEVGHLLAEVGL